MKSLNIIFLTLCSFTCMAQTSQLATILNQHKPFAEIVLDAKKYFNCANEDSLIANAMFQDNEYTHFQRWQHMHERKLMPNGFVADPMIDYLEYKKVKRTRSNSWKAVGQDAISQTPNGIGRVDALGFHPTDSNIMYLGTWAGGIFKTTDGGQHWISIGDDLPYASVGNICVDAINPNIIFITVGHGNIDGSGIGIYKSIDGGATWTPTSQINTGLSSTTYNHLIKHPTNNSIMYSCQSNGLYKTMDGGNTWTLVNNYDITRLHFNPLNPNTMYLVGSGFGTTPAQIFKSINGGNSFVQISNFTNALFIYMSLTMADTNFIGARFMAISSPQYYISSNGGSTFTLQNANNTIDNGGRTIVSQLNKNRLYTGFPTLYKSTDAGITFASPFTNIHVDTRGIFLSPFNKRYIYLCTDGGLYRLDDSLGTTLSLSEGLNITHFYNIAVSEKDTVKLLGGSLDNGSRYKNVNSFWKHTTGGDGFACAINSKDTNIMYTSSQNGAIYRTTNSWNGFGMITPSGQSGAFSTELLLNPQNPSSLYTIFHNVYKASNHATIWNPISNFTSFSASGKLQLLAVAPQDSNVIYAGYRNTDKYFHTYNEGVTWDSFMPPVTFTSYYISEIAIHPQDKNKVLVTKGGYFEKDKIYISADKGLTWNNISYNLPNVPMLCMAIDNELDISNVTIYVGTSIGVYSMKEKDTFWTYVGTGLPRTDVNELAIRKLDRKLIAGTGGRGAYEIALPISNSPTVINNNTVVQQEFNCNNPASNVLYLSNIPSNISKIKILDLSGKVIFQEMRTHKLDQMTLNIGGIQNGIYLLELSGGGERQVKKIVVLK